MASSTTVINGRLEDAQGNPIANEYIYFRLKQAGADNDVTPTTTYGRGPVEGLTDSSGDVKASDGTSDFVVWVNGDSNIQSIYEITAGNGRIEPTLVIVPSSASGGSIEIGELLINHVATGSTPQQSSVLDEAKQYTDQELEAFAGLPSYITTFDPTEWRDGLGVYSKLEDDSFFDDPINNVAFNAPNWLNSLSLSSSDDVSFKSIELFIGPTIDTIETTITDDDTHIPTSGAVVDYAQDKSEIQTTITDSDSNYPTSGAVVDYVDQETPTTQKLVRQASDLAGTLDSNCTYVIDGNIDMGSQSIEIPAGGVTFQGAGAINSGLTSNASAYTMFKSPVGGSGTVTFLEMQISVSGVVSKAFDLTSVAGQTKIFALNRCSLASCTEIGEIDGYAVITLGQVQDFFCGTGWTISGTVIDMEVNGYASTGMLSGGTMFTEGSSLDFTRRCLIEDSIFTIDAGVTVSDFTAANFSADAGFEVLFNDFSGAGTGFSNLSSSDRECRWRDNNWDPQTLGQNTYVGAVWSLTSETVTPATQNNYVKLLGTTTYGQQVWFSNTTDNAHVYSSSRSIRARVQGVVSVSSGNNNQLNLRIRQWDDSAGAYVDAWTSPILTTNGFGRGEAKAILAFVDLEENDRIELWAQNTTDNDDITLLENSLLIVEERAN